MMRNTSFLTGFSAVALVLVAMWSAMPGGAATLKAQNSPSASLQSSENSDRLVLDEQEARLASVAHLLPPDTKSLISTGELNYGEFVWSDVDPGKGDVTVWVDLRRQMVSVYRAGHEIGTAVMLYGKPGKETPLGTFKVLRKVADYHSRTYDSPMPYSLFITHDGVALHGSDVRFGRATHGCIGLPEAFAKHLYQALGVGDEVTIVYSDAGETERIAGKSEFR